LGGVAIIVCAWSHSRAQQPRITIEVSPDSGRAVIDGTGTPGTRWSFRDSYAGILGLGNRIERFVLLDDQGNEISTRTIAPGQFESAKPGARFRYEVNLKPPSKTLDSARVSWLTLERGLILPADLLPLAASNDAQQKAVLIRFKAPAGWTVQSIEPKGSDGAYAVSDADRAVFALGRNLRVSRMTDSGMNFSLVLDSGWAFTDDEALKMVGEVLKAHRQMFGAAPASEGSLILFPFAFAASPSDWSAETRGATVTLLSGKLPSKTGALAQLSTPLTHELFHLWVPNGLALEGDYDWFYEGFTVYQAALVAVSLGQLTFPEFLNSIARAYDAYLSDNERDRWSLIEASQRRWTGGARSVYSKSMLVAFLIDLKLRRESHSKHSLEDVYRKLFGQNRMPVKSSSVKAPDGNETLMNLLAVNASPDGFKSLVNEKFVIDLPRELAGYGLTVENFGLRTRISVNDKLSKQQRDLLRDLGYNDVVRLPRH